MCHILKFSKERVGSIMKRKDILLISFVIMISCIVIGCGNPAKEAAKEAYKNEVSRIEAQIEERDAEIEKAEILLKVDEKALDNTIETSLQKAIENASSNEIKIPGVPSDIDEIYKVVDTIKGIDITEEINDIRNMEQALADSRKQYKMLVCPKEDFIIERLKNVKDINKIEAATEDNDPNGKLNKPGGYVAQIYFSSPLVKDPYGLNTGDVVEDGTDSGGSIEVYKSVAEAKKRNKYLSGFDGTFLDNGSHKVYGTIIIRTSEELTATQQNSLEEDILTALTELE